jgi:hypothetical protein
MSKTGKLSERDLAERLSQNYDTTCEYVSCARAFSVLPLTRRISRPALRTASLSFRAHRRAGLSTVDAVTNYLDQGKCAQLCLFDSMDGPNMAALVAAIVGQADPAAAEKKAATPASQKVAGDGDDAASDEGAILPVAGIETLRVWGCDVGDEGCGAIASLLSFRPFQKSGGLTMLDLMDCNVAKLGCFAIGSALAFEGNQSLTQLRMDFNRTVAAEGATALLLGLRSNWFLTDLSLKGCNIGPEAADTVKQMLQNQRSGLTTLDLEANSLGSYGLLKIAEGLASNAKLLELKFSRNGVGTLQQRTAHSGKIEASLVGPHDAAAFAALNAMLLRNKTLATLELEDTYGDDGIQRLRPALVKEEGSDVEVNTTLTKFLPDPNLASYGVFCRSGGGGGGKKKKKGKGKGKKKKK